VAVDSRAHDVGVSLLVQGPSDEQNYFVPMFRIARDTTRVVFASEDTLALQ